MNDYYVPAQRENSLDRNLDSSTLSRQQVDKSNVSVDENGDYTEVFSWGSDRHGQLGLGKSVSSSNSNLVYSMGNNIQGQLGIGEPNTTIKTSPVLVETMIGLYPMKVSCGSNHTLVSIKCGQVYSWGSNEFGQCGCGQDPYRNPVYWSPQRIVFDEKLKPFVEEVESGGNHSCFIDDQRRLFMCGKGDQGQLGTGYLTNEITPRYISSPAVRVRQAAGGEDHTLLLSTEGEVFVMGTNMRGQLGLGERTQFANTPTMLRDLSTINVQKIRAGQFSGALSRDNQLYLWGCSIFGDFFTPHRVKSVNSIDIDDFKIGRSGFIAVLTQRGQVFSWGQNEYGQLGQGDQVKRNSPHLIEPLATKRVSQIALGLDFIIALGQTMPMAQQQHQRRPRQVTSSRRDEAPRDNFYAKHNPPHSHVSKEKFETLNYSQIEKKHQSNNKTSFRIKVKDSSRKHQQPNSTLNKTITSINNQERQQYTPLRSSPERQKSQPKKKIKSKKAVNEAADLLYRAPSAIHENVVSTLRREKDSASLQLHHERNARRLLETENEELRHQLVKLEADVRELYDMKQFYQTDKERCQAKHNSEFEHIQTINQKLMNENEDLKKQLYNVDVQSRESVNRYHSLQSDYEKIRGELDSQIHKNDDLNKELWRTIDDKKKLEDEMRALQAEVSSYKANISDQGAQNLREISLLKKQGDDLRYQIEDLMSQLKLKNKETEQLNLDIYSWQEVVERLNKENTELKEVISELEHKNRQLLHRIDEMLNKRAIEYKERILSTITKNDSPSKSTKKTEDRLHTIVNEERSQTREALRLSTNKKQPVPQYEIRKHLDRMEESANKLQGRQLNSSTLDPYAQSNQPIEPYNNKSEYSPLRQRGFTSPQQRQSLPSRDPREDLLDEKLRRARQSTGKMGNAVGLNSSMSPIHPNRPINFPQTSVQNKDSPIKYASPSRADNSAGYQTTFGDPNQANTASTFAHQSKYASGLAAQKVRQSLQEIRQQVDAIRREKEAVEQSLNAYENRQQNEEESQ